MYEIVINDRTYTIHTDAENKPYKASRYNEEYKIQVELLFSNEGCSASKKEVQEILRGLYINRVLGCK